jgi:histone H3/H4
MMTGLILDSNENSENTETLRGRISLASGRDSDIRPVALTADDTETTFVLTVPQRDPSEEPQLDDPLDLPDLDNDEGSHEENELDDTEEMGGEELQPQSSANELYDDVSMQDTTQPDVEIINAKERKIVRKKKLKVSKHGIQYPSFPAGVVKKLATTFARTAGNSKAKINKEALEAIVQASDWFFEQVSDDLGAYAKHAGRKTIDESDMVTLMARYVEAPARLI